MDTALFVILLTSLPLLATPLSLLRRNKKPNGFPRAPKFENLGHSFFTGCFPAIRKDAAGALLTYADYCWENDLPGLRLSLGIAGSTDIVFDPDIVDFVMSDNAPTIKRREGIFYKSRLDRRGVGLLTGTGVLLSDGPDHTRKRRLILPSFDTKSLSSFLNTMSDVSKEYATRLITFPENSTNVPQFTSGITMKIVGLCLFSADFISGEIYDDIQQCLDHVVYVTRNPLAAPRWMPTRRNRRFRKSLKALDDLVFDLVEKGRERMSNAANGDKDAPRKLNLLEMLLRARYEDEGDGGGLSDKELRDELITLFLAGHETSANALSWAIWFLSDPQNQEWQDLISAEYDVVQERYGGFTLDSIQDPEALKHTRAVLCETLRIRVPSYAVTREVQEDICCPGKNRIDLKKGSIMILSPFAMHHDPRTFDDPMKFDPSRFLTSYGKDPWDGPFDRKYYLPFGAGRKRCIGYRFAQWEMLIILSTLVKHLRVSRSNDWETLNWESGVTLKTDPGFEVVFNPR